MEPTERKPHEVEGNGIVEDEQNWNVGVETVSGLIGQVCLYSHTMGQ